MSAQEGDGRSKQTKFQEALPNVNDVEDSNLGVHENVTQMSVENENEVANILAGMQKLAEESQGKLEKLAAENLLFLRTVAIWNDCRLPGNTTAI